MDTRDQVRVAVNQARFRQVNEAIERGNASRAELVGFVCECGGLGCTEILELSIEEYEAVRRSPRRFLLVEGHQAAIDETVERHPRYTVVDKIGYAGEVAAGLDPRGDGPTS